MKNLAVLFSTILTLKCFGAGATVSSLNGLATNLNVSGNGNVIYQGLGTLTAVTNATYYYGTNVQGSIKFLQTTPSSAWSILTNGTWKYAVTNTSVGLVFYTNVNDLTNVICNDVNNAQGFGYWTVLDNTNDTSFVTVYFFIDGSPAITNVWKDGVDLLTPTNFLAYSGLFTQTNSEPYFSGNMKGGYLFGVTNFLLNLYQYDNASKFAWGLWASNTTGSLIPIVAFSQEGSTPSIGGTESLFGGDFNGYNIAHHLYNAGRYFGVSLVWWLQDPTRDNRTFIIKGQAYSNIVSGAGMLFETHAATNSFGSHGIFNNPQYFSARGLTAIGNLTDASDSGSDNLETNLFAWLSIIPSGSRWSGSTSAIPAIAIFPQTNLVVVPSNSIEYDGRYLYLDDSNIVRSSFVTSGTTNLIATNILGTIAGDASRAGFLGEIITNGLASAAPTNLVTTTPTNVCSVVLTAGDWDVTGVAGFTPNSATTIQALAIGLTTTTASMPAVDSGSMVQFDDSLTGGADTVAHAPTVRFNVSGSTTVFLTVKGTFGINTLKAYGYLRARRVR